MKQVMKKDTLLPRVNSQLLHFIEVNGWLQMNFPRNMLDSRHASDKKQGLMEGTLVESLGYISLKRYI